MVDEVIPKLMDQTRFVYDLVPRLAGCLAGLIHNKLDIGDGSVPLLQSLIDDDESATVNFLDTSKPSSQTTEVDEKLFKSFLLEHMEAMMAILNDAGELERHYLWIRANPESRQVG